MICKQLSYAKLQAKFIVFSVGRSKGTTILLSRGGY